MIITMTSTFHIHYGSLKLVKFEYFIYAIAFSVISPLDLTISFVYHSLMKVEKIKIIINS